MHALHPDTIFVFRLSYDAQFGGNLGLMRGMRDDGHEFGDVRTWNRNCRTGARNGKSHSFISSIEVDRRFGRSDVRFTTPYKSENYLFVTVVCVVGKVSSPRSASVQHIVV